MNTIKFSMLEITVESEFSFRDDGFVDDPIEHAKKLLREMGDDNEYDDLEVPEGEEELGMCMVPDDKSAIIFYKHSKNLADQIYDRAIQETYALYAMGQISLLQEKMPKVGLRPDFGKMEPEKIAKLGGFYALKKHGYTGFDLSAGRRANCLVYDIIHEGYKSKPF